MCLFGITKKFITDYTWIFAEKCPRYRSSPAHGKQKSPVSSLPNLNDSLVSGELLFLKFYSTMHGRHHHSFHSLIAKLRETITLSTILIGLIFAGPPFCKNNGYKNTFKVKKKMNVTGYFGQKQGNLCGQSQRNTDNTVNQLNWSKHMQMT